MTLPRLRSVAAQLCLALLACGLTARGLRAQVSIGVTNFNFETGGLADGDYTSGPGVIPSGWTASPSIGGAFFGYYNPQNGAYAGTTGANTNGTMAGPNIFYFGTAANDQGIQQTVAANYASNTDYALTVAVGTRATGGASNVTAALKMDLLAGSTVIATSTVRNGTADTFADFTLTFSSVVAGSTYASAYGQALTIRLRESNVSYSGDMDIDNVRLTSVSAIPEPATTAAIGGLIALLGAAVVRRRKALTSPAQFSSTGQDLGIRT